MEWRDEGVILSVRTHGETSAIIEMLTREHGRHLGLVHGGRSRRLRPILQPGNVVDARWRARLSDQLGTFTVELERPFAAKAMETRIGLSGLETLCTLARLLPERDPHPAIYEVTLFVLECLDQPEIWPALLVRWELALLEELGFGLDLGACAATGSNDDLIYVSPKTGKAVSASAGEPYRDRLLRLPRFLRPGDNRDATARDVIDGFRLNSHFLERHVFHPREQPLPDARTRLLHYLEKVT